MNVTLVGPEAKICPALEAALHKRHSGPAGNPIKIVNASEWITMEDPGAAQAVRTKRDSSMRVGLKLVHFGAARGFFTAEQHGRGDGHGEDGAARGAGCSPAGAGDCVPDDHRAAGTLMLDVGANVDSDPENLVQFAGDGCAVRAECAEESTEPRAGLLSIGEEDSKGDSLTRATLPLLRELKGINFIGNVEGRDLLDG